MRAVRIPVIIVDDEGPDDDDDITLVSCMLCRAKTSARYRCPGCAGAGYVTPDTAARQRLYFPKPSV